MEQRVDRAHTGLSGLLNLLTQIILARHIGMGGVSDGFFVAYVVPDTVAGIFLSLALLVLLPRVVDDHGITTQGRALCWTFAGLAAEFCSFCHCSCWLSARR